MAEPEGRKLMSAGVLCMKSFTLNHGENKEMNFPTGSVWNNTETFQFF